MSKFGTLSDQEVRILRDAVSAFLSQTNDALNLIQENDEFQERWGTDGAERAASGLRADAQAAQDLLDAL